MAGTSNAYPELERDLSFHPASNTDPQKLSRQQIRQFNDRGYISPLDVFSPEEADAHRAFFDGILAAATVRGHNSYSINGWHRTCRSIHDLVTAPRILDYVQDLLGQDLICWGTHYFCKMPGEGKRVSWHQDASYWPLTPARTVTVWLAIDDASEENGAMQVIPGSHLHGQVDYEHSAVEEDNVLNQTVCDPRKYGEAPVALAMRAGQISLHADLLLHGSEPNRSTQRRCGLTMRFVPSDVRAHNGWHKSAIICRGSNPEGHWVHHPRPAGDEMPA
ncbi:MAG: phytanoyl-CoA dioxygenase family protein [Gemmatimonadetes bacterium]|nr:phytanoyl-CoA dioxygenase family protein [Gemmatimonadota bacterium]